MPEHDYIAEALTNWFGDRHPENDRAMLAWAQYDQLTTGADPDIRLRVVARARDFYIEEYFRLIVELSATRAALARREAA